MEIYLNFLLLVVSIFARTVASYQLDPTWPHSSVREMKVYGSGIVLNSEGNLIVLHRSGIMAPGAPVNQTIEEDVVLIVDSVTGKLLRSWGKSLFVWPHGLAVTDDGDIFITDSRLHQVFKFKYDPLTKTWNEAAILILGQRFVPGKDASHFCTPSDIALVPGSGDFFVSDGYCNSRIVKFDKNGNYLFEFSAGSYNTPYNPIPFNITHSVGLAPSSNSSEYLVFVADRDNSRLQCFNSTGAFLYEMNHQELGASGMPMVFAVTHAPHPDAKFGRIYVSYGTDDTGRAKFVEVEINSESANVIKSYPITPLGEDVNGSEAPHDIAVGKDGNTVFVVVSRTDLVLKRYTRDVGGEVVEGWVDTY